jgi:ABC-type sulfate transport system permease subunit
VHRKYQQTGGFAMISSLICIAIGVIIIKKINQWQSQHPSKKKSKKDDDWVWTDD